MTTDHNPSRKYSSKQCLFLAEVKNVNGLIMKGIGIPLSDIRGIKNEKHGKEVISNKEVKLFRMEHFEDDIPLSESDQRNESLLAFPLKIKVKDVIQRLPSLSNIKKKQLRQSERAY